MGVHWLSIFLLTAHTVVHISGYDIDCRKPPQLTNPVDCCREVGQDPTMENCYKRIIETEENKWASEKIACFAQCVLADSGYLQETSQSETLNFDIIRQDLENRFPNDTIFVNTMVDAYSRCLPKATDRMQAFRQMPMTTDILTRSCSQFSSILLSCTFIEYFKSCPTHLWNDVEPCQMTRDFFLKCA